MNDNLNIIGGGEIELFQFKLKSIYQKVQIDFNISIKKI